MRASDSQRPHRVGCLAELGLSACVLLLVGGLWAFLGPGLGVGQDVTAVAESPDARWTARIVYESAGAVDGGWDAVDITPSSEESWQRVYAVSRGFAGRLRWRDPTHLVLEVTGHASAEPFVFEPGAHGAAFAVDYRIERPVRVEVPPTFEGPAAVVFGDPGGAPLPLALALRCDVGTSGVLRTSEPWPEAGVSSIDFRLCYDDGTDRPLPVRGAAFEGEVQLVTHFVEERGPRTILGFTVGRKESVEDARAAAESLVGFLSDR